MGLFVNPVTLTDGVDTTRIFSFRAQVADAKSIIGEYIEDGPSIAENSLLVVKHDARSTTPRHLLQRKTNRKPAATLADTLLPITVNVTFTGSNLFSAAEWQTELNIVIDAMQESNFLSGMLSGKI